MPSAEMPAHWRASRIHSPYSSAVRRASVKSRQWSRSFGPSKTPSTVLVFPTSMVSSIFRTWAAEGGRSQAPERPNPVYALGPDAGPDLLHVSGKDPLQALLGAEQERPVG